MTIRQGFIGRRCTRQGDRRLLGLAVGDAVGTTLEFPARDLRALQRHGRRRAVRLDAGPVDPRHLDGGVPGRSLLDTGGPTWGI